PASLGGSVFSIRHSHPSSGRSGIHREIGSSSREEIEAVEVESFESMRIQALRNWPLINGRFLYAKAPGPTMAAHCLTYLMETPIREYSESIRRQVNSNCYMCRPRIWVSDKRI